MLTLVINPGGRPRVVTIAEALYLLGVDIRRSGQAPDRTPEEQRRHKQQLVRELRRRMLERERGAER